MINSGSVQQGSPYLRILTDDQIYEIKRSAFDVMYHVGFKVLHAGARKMLKQAGANREAIDFYSRLLALDEALGYRCAET